MNNKDNLKMANKLNYFVLILKDDTIGIVNQFYVFYFLSKFNRIKKYKTFHDLQSAQRYLIQYIFINLSLEDYGIADNSKEAYDFEINKFIQYGEYSHKVSPIDIIFNNNGPTRRKCMRNFMNIKKPKSGFYTVVILKNDAIGILESKEIFDDMRNNGHISHYKLLYTYREADEYIRKVIPFHEWERYHLDLGYLRINQILRPYQDDYDNLQDYCTIDLSTLKTVHHKKSNTQEQTDYYTTPWEAPPLKSNFHYNPDEIHKVRTSGYVSMDNTETTNTENKKEYISYYNEDLKKWVHKKIK